MTQRARARRWLAAGVTGAVAASVLAIAPVMGAASAEGDTFALVGSLQSELGCSEDWQPACEATHLLPTDTAGVYAAEFTVPAGSWEYKVAANDTWDDAWGLNGGGDNIPLTVGGDTDVRVVFDDAQKRVGLELLETRGAYDEAADASLVAAPARQPGSDENFYFVMTDRFANGDPANDQGGLEGDRLVTGFDPTDKGFYQGGDIQGLRDQLDYIDGLGTTAIWLTPSFKNRPVQGEGANASAGYHGYWITDFTQIDPHLGTNAELEALIAEAHAKGIKIYFDIITNHTADVIDYEEQQYSYIDQATSPYTDASGNVFKPADYAGKEDFPELDAATSFPYTPTVAPEDADLKVPAWLNDPTLYHNRGDSTWSGESVTFGDFVGLDDLMTEHPTVVDGFVDVYQAWVDLGIDGFRIDTAKARQLRVLGGVVLRGARLRAREGEDRLLHVRRGLRRRSGQALPVRPQLRHELGARLHVPVAGRLLRIGQQREEPAVAVRGRRLLHDARLLGHGAAHLPRQPRHGPSRVLPRLVGQRARAR